MRLRGRGRPVAGRGRIALPVSRWRIANASSSEAPPSQSLESATAMHPPSIDRASTDRILPRQVHSFSLASLASLSQSSGLQTLSLSSEHKLPALSESHHLQFLLLFERILRASGFLFCGFASSLQLRVSRFYGFLVAPFHLLWLPCRRWSTGMDIGEEAFGAQFGLCISG